MERCKLCFAVDENNQRRKRRTGLSNMRFLKKYNDDKGRCEYGDIVITLATGSATEVGMRYGIYRCQLDR